MKFKLRRFGSWVPFGFSELIIRISVFEPSDFLSLEPLSEQRQSLMWPRYHLHTDNLPDLRGGRRSGVGCRFHGRNVAPEESGNVTTADFFPADQCDIGGFKRGIARFEQGAQAFALDHSNCLLNH